MTERNRALDGLRGASILWVMGYHLFGRAPVNPMIDAVPGLKGVLGFGWLGVTVFFVLSGYLITAHLVAARDQAGYWRKFLVKRTARILPAYALLLLSMPVAAWGWGATHHATLFNDSIPYWSHVLLVQNVFMASNGYLGNEWLRVTWSLAIEVQYYALIAWVIWVCPPRRLPYYLVGLVLVAVAVRYALFWGVAQSSAPMMVLPLSRMDSFALGGLMALWPIGGWTAVQRRGWWALGILAMLAFPWYANGGFGRATYGLVPVYYLVVSLAIAILVSYAVVAKGRLVAWMGVAPLVEAGQLSYFMYLFHMPVAWVIHDGVATGQPESQTMAGFGRGIAVIALTWLLAKGSQRWLETPSIDLGRRWLGKQPPHPVKSR